MRSIAPSLGLLPSLAELQAVSTGPVAKAEAKHEGKRSPATAVVAAASTSAPTLSSATAGAPSIVERKHQQPKPDAGDYKLSSQQQPQQQQPQQARPAVFGSPSSAAAP